MAFATSDIMRGTVPAAPDPLRALLAVAAIPAPLSVTADRPSPRRDRL